MLGLVFNKLSLCLSSLSASLSLSLFSLPLAALKYNSLTSKVAGRVEFVDLNLLFPGPRQRRTSRVSDRGGGLVHPVGFKFKRRRRRGDRRDGRCLKTMRRRRCDRCGGEEAWGLTSNLCPPPLQSLSLSDSVSLSLSLSASPPPALQPPP